MAMTTKISLDTCVKTIMNIQKSIMDGNQWGRSLEHYDVSMDILFNLTIQ